MVLEPSIAGYGTAAASILYYAVVRLDNLGRCVERAADAGDREVCSSEGARVFDKARRGLRGALMGLWDLADGALTGRFKTGRLSLGLQTTVYYRERR
jgi:hypothetical protein